MPTPFAASSRPASPLRETLFDDGRFLGWAPPVNAKQVRGVVVEVGLEGGLDLLAAYADQTARYYNYSGAGIVWERGDASLDAQIDVLLACGQTICDRIGPWEGERPAPPPTGQVRINLLTPSGLHFGQGPLELLSRDGLGGPALAAATALMQSLIAKSQ
jgi:hypothetical protein